MGPRREEIKRYYLASTQKPAFKVSLNSQLKQPSITFSHEDTDTSRIQIIAVMANDSKSIIIMEYQYIQLEYRTPDRQINIGTILNPIFEKEVPKETTSHSVMCILH